MSDFMYIGIPNCAIAEPVTPIATPNAAAEIASQVDFADDIASLLIVQVDLSCFCQPPPANDIGRNADMAGAKA